MVLLVALGWALERFAGLRNAMILALFVGFLVAPFIPLGGRGCGTEGRGPVS